MRRPSSNTSLLYRLPPDVVDLGNPGRPSTVKPIQWRIPAGFEDRLTRAVWALPGAGACSTTGHDERLAAAYRRRARAVGSGKNLGRRQERMLVSFRLHLRGIMAGLVPAIQVFRFAQAFDTWMLGARLALRQFLLLLVAGLGPALAQDAGTLDEKQMAPLAHPDSPATPARELFARKTRPVPLAARSIFTRKDALLHTLLALPASEELPPPSDTAPLIRAPRGLQPP